VSIKTKASEARVRVIFSLLCTKPLTPKMQS